MDNAPTPEQQITQLAQGIAQQRGVTSGRALIAAREMVTEAEKRFGANSAAALAAYQPGQNPKQFLDGFQNAYIAGTLGNLTALTDSRAAGYLTEEQREIAYELGTQAAEQRGVQETVGESSSGAPEERGAPKHGVANSPKSATMVDEKGRIHEDKLMLLPIPERATAIEKLLGYYTDKESKWKGETIISNRVQMPRARGKKLWSCQIQVRDDAGIKTLIHELLHARSVSHWNELAYTRWKFSEEAAVELFSQQICERNGIKYETSYSSEVEKLIIICKILKPNGSIYDFAKEFYEVDMLQRCSWLRAEADELINRKVLAIKTEETLNKLVEFFSRRKM